MAKKKEESAPPEDGQKKLSLDHILANCRKVLSKDLSTLEDVKIWLPSGSPRLDLVMGGGFPYRKLTTLIGEKSIGKSSIGFKALAMNQRYGGISGLEDVERSGWEKRSQKIGIDLGRLLISKPKTLDTFVEEYPDGSKEKRKGVFDIIEAQAFTIRKFSPNILMANLVDSIGGSSIAREMDADTGQAQMGAHSGVASQGLRKIMGYVDDLDMALIMINQLKTKVGVMFGDNVDYLCKKPLDFWSSITVQMTRVGQYPPYDKSNPAPAEAVVTKCYVSKNKVYDPFKKCEITVFFDRGIDELFESIEALDEQKRLGSTQGYVEFAGVKRRKKELWEEAQQKSALAKALIDTAYKMVDEITGRKMENLLKYAQKGSKNENQERDKETHPVASVLPPGLTLPAKNAA